MTTTAKLNPKEVRDEQYEEKAQLKAVEEKIYQTMEVSKLLTQITMQKERIEELRTLVEKVEAQQKIERDNHLLATMKWEKDLQAKISELEGVTKELEQTKRQNEERTIQNEIQRREEVEYLKSESSGTMNHLNKKIMELNEELRSIKEFKERQDEYNLNMENMKKRIDELIHTHNDDLKRIDNQNSKAIQMQQDKHEKEINEIHQEAKKEAEQEVEKLEHKVIEDNKKLRLELIEYKKEIEILKKEKERVLEENRQIRQNISLQEDGVVEYQAIHYRQESKIKKLKEKVQVLKAYIAQEVNKHTKESEALKYQSQVRINELETQLATVREELKFRVKESNSLKTLSQIILDQRSEIEEFLLETLDHVKEEVRKQRQTDRKNRLPEINSKSRLDIKPKKSWEKLDITSLDWEDKEKILRILFSKMNTGLPPSNWRSALMERSSELINQQSLSTTNKDTMHEAMRSF